MRHALSLVFVSSLSLFALGTGPLPGQGSPATSSPQSLPKARGREAKAPPPLRPLGSGLCFLSPHRLLDLRIDQGGLPGKGRWDIPALLKSFTLFGTDGLVIEITDSKSDWILLPKLLDALDRLSRVHARVWVAIRPPTQGGNSEPFLGAYVRWAEELAKLAPKHPSLSALYIPQIYQGKNLFVIHPGKLERMRKALHAQGLNLVGQFYDLVPENLADYGPLLDGIVLHYTNTQSALNLESFLFMARKIAPRPWKVLGGYSLGPNLFNKDLPPPWLLTYFIRHAMFRCDGFLLDGLRGTPGGGISVGGPGLSKRERKTLQAAMLQSVRKYWKPTPLPSKKKSK